jgi:hypothetical protein
MGCSCRATNRSSAEPTLRTNGEVPRQRSKAVDLVLVQANQNEPQPTSALENWLTSGPPSPWWVNLSCPKLVPCSGGPFDPCKTKRRVLIGWSCVPLRVCFLALEAVMWVLQSSCFLVIGRCFVPWIRRCVFPLF